MQNNSSQSSFVYVTYIRTTPEKLWTALTDREFIKQYWFGIDFRTEWKAGAEWRMVYADGRDTDVGEITEFDPPKRLVLKWQNVWRPELKAEGWARCVIEVEPVPDAVKLTVAHAIDCPDSKLIEAVSGGWPKIISNLKSLLETGQVVLKP